MNKQTKFYLSLVIVFLLFAIAVLISNYYGETDVKSFTSTSKYFAESYQAKIRSSHSYLWGFVNAPLVKLFGSFIGFKILNLIILLLIILSIYYMSNKNNQTLLLLLFTPIIWYMAPYINSIQIASLFFLWSYYFINRFDKDKKLINLFSSGILFGLAAAFWHAIFFFGIFFIFIFLYDKKLIHFLYYILAIIIGLIPLFILDYFIFGFIFHSLIKNNIGTLSNLLSLGVYSVDATAPKTWLTILSVIVMIPLYFWKLYEKKTFKKYKKTVLFLTIALLIILKNPQIRYLLLIVPIYLLILLKTLDKKQIERLTKISLAITLVVMLTIIMPKYDIETLPIDTAKTQDLIQIAIDYPNEIFIVGNWADDYERLAILYWGKDIKEFVSIQDYELYLNNESILIEREFRSSPRINGRREFWIKGGIGKPKDDTDYESIKYMIIPYSTCEQVNIDNFILVKNYQILSVYRKQRIDNEQTSTNYWSNRDGCSLPSKVLIE